jgi:S-adenosylmethionine:tRNA ribosyltransferase-isomerase
VTSLVPPPAATALPMGREAHEPAEARGLRRDGVRLLVSIGPEEPVHARFIDLPRQLAEGDLLVVNTSATVPAALDVETGADPAMRLHVSTRLPGELWLAEARIAAGVASTPFHGDLTGTTLRLPDGGTARMLQRFAGSQRLWMVTLELPMEITAYLHRWGQPIRYTYVNDAWPISAYQTVFATTPGSAEMPGAGRPFSHEVITALTVAGVGICPVTLHTGVSSLEGGEDPYPEPYSVPADTARRINETHTAGRRVIAVGTTVVRALETVTDATGTVHPGAGWTDLVVTPARGVAAVDGLLTGLHEPAASHLQMLEAISGPVALRAAYAAAVDAGYLWHEFGDSHLVIRRD